MSDVGVIKSVTIATNRDDKTNTVRLAQVEMSSAQDIQTVQLAGDDDRGHLAETKVIVLDIGAGWKIGIPILDGVTPTAADGERYLYSQDPATKEVKASIKLKADGKIIFNDGEDYAVAFERMKTAFDQLKSDHDNHTHIVSGTANLATGAVSGTAAKVVSGSTADMSSAKSEKVLIP